ncbi:DUF3889 domain-containing protein [Ornithinibacillus sp. 179-J 7C1 HS]|uniref:DUF3889 domain-containing protein n=1 Tax=Ornithinibacillus sp. 179-J 7C1 HS TaxID=3142384 RepID=UPI0039A38C39
MRKYILMILSFSVLCFGIASFHTPLEEISAQEEPSYAKWGRLAMQKVKEKYPDANIVDYLHVGRKKGIENSTETFKLWLETPKTEFGVFIDITFDNNTEEIVDIKYREVSS